MIIAGKSNIEEAYLLTMQWQNWLRQAQPTVLPYPELVEGYSHGAFLQGCQHSHSLNTSELFIPEKHGIQNDNDVFSDYMPLAECDSTCYSGKSCKFDLTAS
ncbi:hypothetical protein JW964_18310 [candidate division KSB1 bacterium]|nr:hypothetical protein [candidate division KSB1 bacterium]